MEALDRVPIVSSGGHCPTIGVEIVSEIFTGKLWIIPDQCEGSGDLCFFFFFIFLILLSSRAFPRWGFFVVNARGNKFRIVGHVILSRWYMYVGWLLLGRSRCIWGVFFHDM